MKSFNCTAVRMDKLHFAEEPMKFYACEETQLFDDKGNVIKRRFKDIRDIRVVKFSNDILKEIQ